MPWHRYFMSVSPSHLFARGLSECDATYYTYFAPSPLPPSASPTTIYPNLKNRLHNIPHPQKQERLRWAQNNTSLPAGRPPASHHRVLSHAAEATVARRRGVDDGLGVADLLAERHLPVVFEALAQDQRQG